MRPAVFLDRDDTLIDDMSYTADAGRLRLKPGAPEALARLRQAGFALVVVTNQSGVARGHFTEEQLQAAHQRLREMLTASGAALDAIYYCPYLDGPEAVVAAYRRQSDMRKPAPGMLLTAARELGIDLAASWMIGDAPRDVEAGRAAGCRTILIGNGAAPQTVADHVAPSLSTAADIVLSERAMAGGNGAGRAESDGNGQARAASTAAANEAGGWASELLYEVRQWRRESRRQDFTPAHIVGVVAQSLAVAFLGWGLYGMLDTKADAMVRLMAAVCFQLIAMTYLRRR